MYKNKIIIAGIILSTWTQEKGLLVVSIRIKLHKAIYFIALTCTDNHLPTNSKSVYTAIIRQNNKSAVSIVAPPRSADDHDYVSCSGGLHHLPADNNGLIFSSSTGTCEKIYLDRVHGQMRDCGLRGRALQGLLNVNEEVSAGPL